MNTKKAARLSASRSNFYPFLVSLSGHTLRRERVKREGMKKIIIFIPKRNKNLRFFSFSSISCRASCRKASARFSVSE
jgi:hypothetical protein